MKQIIKIKETDKLMSEDDKIVACVQVLNVVKLMLSVSICTRKGKRNTTLILLH